LDDDACAEVFFYQVNTTIHNPKARTTDLEHRAFTSWSTDQMRINFKFSNKFDYDVDFYWSDESVEPIRQGLLIPGDSFEIHSFLGHVFSAYYAQPGESSEEEKGELIDFMVADGLDYAFSPLNRLETCEINPDSPSVFVENLSDCSNLDARFTEFVNQVWYVKRLGLNYVQPQMVPSYSLMGFELRRLPEQTFAWLREWYMRKQLEEETSESGAGPCMNQHAAPTGITHLDQRNKQRLTAELQPIMEEWYGGELEMTSIYGIRKYINGSILRMHVDTVNTHVVSAIINVDQEVDRDWPLLILDHDYEEHSVNMRPGDMMLYESAKSLHGRPDVFSGSHYDNIFIHFKPAEGWDYGWV